MSGGGAELFGLDKMVENVFGISVTLAPTPIDCVAKGLSRINSFIPTKMRTNGKDVTDSLVKFYDNKKQNKE